MLNRDKVVLMSQLAMAEKNEEEDLKLYKYYKADYIRYNLIRTVLNVTLAYILLVFLILLYKIEDLIARLADFEFAGIGKSILKGYILVLIVYLVIGFVYYANKYNKSKKNIVRYYKKLRQLSMFYNDEKKQGV